MEENNPIRIWRFQGGDLTQGMKGRYQALLGIQAWGQEGSYLRRKCGGREEAKLGEDKEKYCILTFKSRAKEKGR